MFNTASKANTYFFSISLLKGNKLDFNTRRSEGIYNFKSISSCNLLITLVLWWSCLYRYGPLFLLYHLRRLTRFWMSLWLLYPLLQKITRLLTSFTRFLNLFCNQFYFSHFFHLLEDLFAQIYSKHPTVKTQVYLTQI